MNNKNKKYFSCNACGSVLSKWLGQCPDCGAWGAVSEELAPSGSLGQIITHNAGTAQGLESLDNDIVDTIRTKTAIDELNRVLGGGLVSGSAVLIGGDPGIGKSTLLLQLSAKLAAESLGCLYITGEESTNQIKLRAERLGLGNSKTMLLSSSNVEDIIATIDKNKQNLKLVVIDSIQTMATNNLASGPGTVSQVKAAAHLLITYAKQNNITLFIACHVNKDGQLAGPKILEHMVDTVLYFEGDHNNYFRILRAIKNRFGGVNEIGVFEMTSKGLVEISNPSELFLMERENNVSGNAVFAGLEGSRPILIEIQALTCPSTMVTPRRSVVGWDVNRLSMIIAVLNVRFGLNLSASEVYLSIAGGLKITDPAADLAVAAALISAAKNVPLPTKSIFFGEVGLSGEVRRVAQTEARIKEATKLGFERMFCGAASKDTAASTLEPIHHLKQLKSLIV